MFTVSIAVVLRPASVLLRRMAMYSLTAEPGHVAIAVRCAGVFGLCECE